jgi:hypothetical protein
MIIPIPPRRSRVKKELLPNSLEAIEHENIDNEAVQLPGELESLILSTIPGRHNRLRRVDQERLAKEVVVAGKTYKSPNELYEDDDTFKAWARERLEWVLTLENPRRETAVAVLRKYGASFYGFLDYYNREMVRNQPSESLE